MDRGELDSLDRDALIARAEALGIPRARILTRPELVDEILVAGAPGEVGPAADADLPGMRTARGFFGRARDLLARVVERGLHLPDAAERIRRLTPPPPARRPEPAMPTVTLAEIYAAQGHGQRAIETLRSVLEGEPDYAAARALLSRLEAEPPRAPTLPTERDDDDVPTPGRRPPLGATLVPPTLLTGTAASGPRGVLVEDSLGDACVCLPHGDDGIFVFWNAATAADALVLRFVVLRPTWDGPHVEIRDLPVDASRGEAVLRDIPARATVRVALGVGQGRAFAPLAHSAALSVADGVAQRWTLEGTRPVDASDPDATAIACAIARRGAGP